MSKYYTVVIELHNGHNVAGENTITLQDFDEVMRTDFLRRVWACGWPVATSPSTVQVISPFVIKHVFIIQQDKKYEI